VRRRGIIVKKKRGYLNKVNEELDVETLKLMYNSLLEQTSEKSVEYEDKIAKIRTNLHKRTIEVERLQGQVASLQQESASLLTELEELRERLNGEVVPGEVVASESEESQSVVLEEN
jgi:chromosome segregation ATPase